MWGQGCIGSLRGVRHEAAGQGFHGRGEAPARASACGRLSLNSRLEGVLVAGLPHGQNWADGHNKVEAAGTSTIENLLCFLFLFIFLYCYIFIF